MPLQVVHWLLVVLYEPSESKGATCEWSSRSFKITDRKRTRFSSGQAIQWVDGEGGQTARLHCRKSVFDSSTHPAEHIFPDAGVDTQRLLQEGRVEGQADARGVAVGSDTGVDQQSLVDIEGVLYYRWSLPERLRVGRVRVADGVESTVSLCDHKQSVSP